jgi:multiple sugar transport system permease protein
MPALVAMLLVIVFPMAYSLYMCFQNYILATGRPPEFSGIENFARMLHDPRLLNSIEVTSAFSVAAVATEFVLGLAIAVLLSVETKMASALRTLFILIVVTPSIVAAFIWRILYNPLYSPLNYILHILFRLPAEMEWVSNTSTALFSVLIADAWQWTPFVAIVMLAGIYSIPIEPQEAARVDGASTWQLFKNVTLPLLKPLILVVVLIRFMDTIKIFDLIYILTRGGPGTATETLGYYVFVVGFTNFNIGYAAALSWVTALAVEGICLIFIRMLKR